MNLKNTETGVSPATAAALPKVTEYVSLDFLAKKYGVLRRTLESWSPNIAGRTKFRRLVRFHLPTIEKEIAEGRDPFSTKKGGCK